MIASRDNPQIYAHVGGAIYLFIIIAAGFGELFVRGNLIVWHDAARTARNILGSETLFRVGLAGEMLTCAGDVALALILYVLLRPVNRNLALLGAFFRLVFVAIYGVSKLFEIASLVSLGDAEYLKGFSMAQLESFAYVSLRIHSLAYGASFLFFGLCCGIFGILIRASKYLPSLIGTALIIGGIGYVLFSVAQMVSPSFAASYLFPWSILPAFLAEAGLCLWLLFKGVDTNRWAAVVLE